MLIIEAEGQEGEKSRISEELVLKDKEEDQVYMKEKEEFLLDEELRLKTEEEDQEKFQGRR